MSVAPDDPLNLPRHRRPKELDGTGSDPVWQFNMADLSADLRYWQDPLDPKHGAIEPATAMPLSEYEQALEQTRDRWTKAPTTDTLRSVDVG
jgi:hypothetical protein